MKKIHENVHVSTGGGGIFEKMENLHENVHVSM